jgi:hypothetical protein
VLQKWTGHADLAMVQKYLHADKDDLANAAAALQASKTAPQPAVFEGRASI